MSSSVREKMSPSSAMTLASSRAMAPSQPSASMSKAPRLAMPNTRSRSCAGQVDHRPDDLGDDVAGLAQHDGVADEHALALDLEGVVQRGHLDGGAADLDRGHDAERGDPAGAPDVDPDVEELGVDLLRRVL